MNDKIKVIIKTIICAVVGTVLGLGIVKLVRTVVGNDNEEVV